MKIDFYAGLKSYAGKTENVRPSLANPTGEARKKQDISDFSSGLSSLSDKSLTPVKTSIQHTVSAPCSQERLEALRKSVREGTYHVPTQDIVSSILNFPQEG